jgi:hypothetical protein
MSTNAFAELFAAYLNDFFIQVLKAFTTLCWLLEKVAAGCMRFLTEESLWDLLLSGTLSTLQGSMPGILQSVFFGGSGGAGLLYLALMLAGLFLIIPALGNSRPVEAPRVLLWGVFVTVLFISSATGYDLIRYFESMRQNMTTLVVNGISSDTSGLDNIVQTPMYATDSEIQEYGFVLPAQFETHYFTTPSGDDYDDYQLVLGVWPVQHIWTIKVESPDSQADRRTDAQTGLAVATLTLIPGTVLLLFGLIYAVLAAAALILVIFFIVALPVGFFEFGTTILTQIVRQYLYLFAITILTVTLVAVIVASGQLDMSAVDPDSNPNNLMTKIPILLIVTMALSYVSSMATRALTDTFGVVSTSVQSALSSSNAMGRMPAGSGVLSDVAQAAMNVTGAAALAGATGGVGMALTAGAGALVGNLNENAGRAAATLAQNVSPDNQYAQVFGTAARSSRGLSGAAMVGGSAGRASRTLRQRRDQLETTAGRRFNDASQAPQESREFPWQGVNEGTFQAADTELVQQGVQEFQAGKTVTARNTLARAFGSREVAERVMGQLANDPKQSQLPIAAVTQLTNRTAHQTTKAGKALFDGQGNFTPAFQESLWQNVRQDAALKHLNPADAKQVALVGSLAVASVRPLAPLWQDPLATHKLAQTVLEPDVPQIQTQDHAALLNLQGLARIEGWQVSEVEALFEATRTGQSRAALGNGDAVQGVVKEMFTHPELRQLDTATAKEAARLALLITRDSQSIAPLREMPTTRVPQAIGTPLPIVPPIVSAGASGGGDTTPMPPSRPLTKPTPPSGNDLAVTPTEPTS